MRFTLSVVALVTLPALSIAQDLNEAKKFMDAFEKGMPFSKLREKLPADGEVIELHRKKDAFNNGQGDQRDEWFQVALGKKLMARPADRTDKNETPLGTGISANNGFIEVKAGWRLRTPAIGVEHDFDGTLTARVSLTLSKGVWTVAVTELKVEWHGAFLPVEKVASDFLRSGLPAILSAKLNEAWKAELTKNYPQLKDAAAMFSATLVHDKFMFSMADVKAEENLQAVVDRRGGNRVVVPAQYIDKLKIQIIDRSEVDTTAAMVFSAIEVAEKVDGGSVVRFKTGPGGTVLIRGKVDGASVVHIHAPDGHVVIGGEVNGLSQLHITAKSVVFHGKIDGGWNNGRITQVHLTLTEGGVVTAPELCAHLYWRKANPTDSAPRIAVNKVHWDGKIFEVK